VLSIAYVSIATAPMSEDEIVGILRWSRANNERDGITGALLYHQSRSVQIMREKAITERSFPERTMGFRSLSDDSLRQLAGFEDFFARRGSSRLKHADNEAQQFLEWLGEYWLPRA
jgi:hypothetical protein